VNADLVFVVVVVVVMMMMIQVYQMQATEFWRILVFIFWTAGSSQATRASRATLGRRSWRQNMDTKLQVE
jgi:hypothetical protein